MSEGRRRILYRVKGLFFLAHYTKRNKTMLNKLHTYIFITLLSHNSIQSTFDIKTSESLYDNSKLNETMVGNVINLYTLK